ncbi:MAG: glycerophosphodiester phosphodiesterase [Deltaproteobacteria bacterium]|nr:glycerophosphodiester phosphodiesterase [Deltaproteobacteria bacterium]
MKTLSFLLVLQLAASARADMLILAHRGVHQRYSRRDLGPDTCTAERIFEPCHAFLENSLPSMAEAFRLGADMVELDVHATADGKVVVFHDWRLECRTNGQGVVEEQTLASLRALDIGHGYTADGHRTHPFRCRPESKGYAACMRRNRMPTLEEVLLAFPDEQLAINMKSGSMRSMRIILSELRRIRAQHHQDLSRLLFYCGRQRILDAAREQLPEMTVPKLGSQAIGKCLAAYFLSGRFAPECEGAMLALPYERLEALEPAAAAKLVDDVHAAGGKLGLVRVDTQAAYARARALGVDGIWTDRIELIGLPVIHPRGSSPPRELRSRELQGWGLLR